MECEWKIPVPRMTEAHSGSLQQTLSHEGDPAELRVILLTARPGMGCAAGILSGPSLLLVCLPKVAHCDGHPVPEPEETQVAGFPLALQVTAVVVRQQEPIATAAPLSRPFQEGEGCRGVGVASVQPAGRGPGRKDLLLHGLLPHSRGGPVPAAALLTRGLLFQGSARGQTPAPAGGIKGCSAGLPQTPVCSMRQVDAGPRVLTAPACAHTCSERSPLPLQTAG